METRANPIFHDSSKSSSDRGTDRVRTVTSKVRNKLADIASPDPCYIRTDAFRLGKFLSSRYKCPVVYNFQRVNIQIQYRARFRQVIGNDIRAEFSRSYRRSGFYERPGFDECVHVHGIELSSRSRDTGADVACQRPRDCGKLLEIRFSGRATLSAW